VTLFVSAFKTEPELPGAVVFAAGGDRRPLSASAARPRSSFGEDFGDDGVVVWDRFHGPAIRKTTACAERHVVAHGGAAGVR